MIFTFEHFIWLQPSFFCMGDLQLGQGLELVTSHRQLAAVSVSSSVPVTVKRRPQIKPDPHLNIGISDNFPSEIYIDYPCNINRKQFHTITNVSISTEVELDILKKKTIHQCCVVRVHPCWAFNQMLCYLPWYKLQIISPFLCTNCSWATYMIVIEKFS